MVWLHLARVLVALTRLTERIMESLQGQFLVAAKSLLDANFARSVVLMIQHDSMGAFGLIINQPSRITVAEMWHDLEGDQACTNPFPVLIGGPVEGPVLVLHTDRQRAEAEVIPNVFLASERDNIRGLLIDQQHDFRVFTGYSGWGAGQLETEFEVGGWFHYPATKELIFCDDLQQLWHRVINLKGRDFYQHTLGIDDVQEDVTRN